MVVTCHGTVTGELGELYRTLGRRVSLVAISWAQRTHAPDLNWIARVYNAVNVDTFPFSPQKEDWVLWLGRFSPDKGAHLAIDVARAAGRSIVLAGKRCEPIEIAYFDQYVKPRLGPGAEFVGEADAELKRELLSKARCLVFPLQWEEPFGMIMIEAMACGTPVVALRKGSVPELVVNDVTGFIRTTLDELAAAVDAVDRLDPAACRAHVTRNFDVSGMADGYERAYNRVLTTARPQSQTFPVAR
jgi:glycosyltransferase involved in cell wall biosynthesis